jgi:hypothetical protein
MIRRLPLLVSLVASCLLGCFAPRSQAQDSASNNAQTPAAAPTNSPAAPASSEKPKKVWTNDDVKTAGTISVVGDTRNQKYTMTKSADPATVAKYKNDLQKLQTQLDEVTRKLHGYQDFASGKAPTDGGSDLDHGYSRVPVDQQIAKLQDKKKQLESQIDALYDSARKQGIESGQLK